MTERAECMGTAPHGEHTFNGGMWCPGLPDPEDSRCELEAVIVLGNALSGPSMRYDAEADYAHRPGWHATSAPAAPHLSPKGRAWFRVELDGVRTLKRPASQGGIWYLARSMRVLSPV